MTLKLLLLLFLAGIATACGLQELPLPFDARDAGSPVAAEELVTLPTQPATENLEPEREDAGGYARAFYRAWEAGDFVGMYGLLATRSQALVDMASFIDRYESVMTTAAVQQVHAQPLSLIQNDDRAEFGVRVTWDTNVVGPITRDYAVHLVYEDDRWGIEWREGLILPELEGGNRLAMDYKIPARASIYDVNGTALAFQGNAVSLGVVPGEMQDEAGLVALLSEIIGLSSESIRAKYATAEPGWLVHIADIPDFLMQEHIFELQPYIGAGLAPPQARNTRLYAEYGVAPHLVGYTGFIPAEEIDSYLIDGYRGDEMVGRSGLEAWGEDYLNGQRGGSLTVVGSNGEYISTIAEQEPKQARSIYATIGTDFQAAVEQALAEAISSHPVGQAGSVVVMDVNTGDIKAMASYPTYDPGIFDALRPNAGAELNTVLDNLGLPLLNRAAQGAYPAGSVFKIVTYTAALNSGQYTPDTYYNSTGIWTRLGDAYAKTDWRPGGHGSVTLRQALVVSCNTCFYDVGYNLDGQDNAFLAQTARQFGLGERTGITGLAESPGLIPDPEWKIANYGEGWATGDSVNMAIGQGFVQVTPLQITRMLAAIANGGTLIQPKLVDRIGAGGGAPEEPWPVSESGQIPLSAEQLAIMKESLWNVANGPWGTATQRFEGLPIEVAGKTGTAEAPPNSPHAWFAGYAPASPVTLADGTSLSGPEIAVGVMVENSGEGSEVAAPIFRRIIELYYGIEPVMPFPWQSAS